VILWFCVDRLLGVPHVSVFLVGDIRQAERFTQRSGEMVDELDSIIIIYDGKSCVTRLIFVSHFGSNFYHSVTFAFRNIIDAIRSNVHRIHAINSYKYNWTRHIRQNSATVHIFHSDISR